MATDFLPDRAREADLAAKREELKIRTAATVQHTHADYVAEMARSLMFAQYGADAYTRGLKVFLGVNQYR